MVLFKRKPVLYLPRPPIEDDSSEVWVIPETNEVFTNYESFLQRMNFYKQRRFICEITGHSSLTFFEALRSETEGSREVNSAFPEALKEPVLRKIQFSTISRVDNLVDQVFEDFKQDFYPGERVTVLLTNGSRLQGIVREKARFPEVSHPDGSIARRASSRYLVKLINRHNEEALVDDEHLARDRKIFTKQMLRSFIKNTVTRESWNGAPWLVKPQIAEDYRIEQEIPKHLQYGHKVAGKKANVSPENDSEGLFGFFMPEGMPRGKSGGKGQKNRHSAQDLAKAEEDQYLEYQRSLNGNPSFMVPKNGHKSHKHGANAKKTSPDFAVVIRPVTPPPPPPPPIKYPIEDLDIPPVKDDNVCRPELKHLANDTITANEGASEDGTGGPDGRLKMESVGALLETWNTLSVYCEVFQLDSFTFDDFVEAMHFSSDELQCELFVEVHCAILKTLVNAEQDSDGAVQISLPALPEEESEDEEEEEGGSGEESEPEPEPERMTTRSRRAKAEAENKESTARSRSNTADVGVHRAAEMFEDYGWIDRLRKRDFRNGGWEIIMVGLLHRLCGRPRLQQTCDEILAHLAPLDADPTQETARLQYATLDVNLRVQALQIICMLTLETKAIKNYLEECSNQMTEFRKEKIEYQRARKACLEELRKLHEERKQLQPELPPEVVPEMEIEEEIVDVKMADAEDDTEMAGDSDEDEPHKGRALRRGEDRAIERKRRQEEAREKKEQAAKQPKGSKQYQRVLKKIEDEKAKVQSYEEEIAAMDNDLREADCARTRVLGKDRFCNRYFWFERNGMPYEGLPSSSTASANYSNGRLWVQGPDDMEVEGFIDIPEKESKEYAKQFDMTVRQRKELEEGPSGLWSGREWGYYEDEESLDKLISWLDTRGVREVKLKKELQLQRDVIARYMKNRQDYLIASEERAESEEPQTRISTRKKAYADDSKYRCLKWKNTTALRENGHLHVDAMKPSKRQKRTTDDAKDIKAATNRQGKPLTRQGGRYNF